MSAMSARTTIQPSLRPMSGRSAKFMPKNPATSDNGSMIAA